MSQAYHSRIIWVFKIVMKNNVPFLHFEHEQLQCRMPTTGLNALKKIKGDTAKKHD